MGHKIWGELKTMEISITKNEFTFYPDIQDNLGKPEKERFTIILQTLNSTLFQNKWVEYGKDGKVENVNMTEFYKAHIVRFINPPFLKDERGETVELTKENLYSNEYKGLESIIDQIIIEIEKINNKDGDETKKS